MTGIKDYSTTPASNTALFPEGMAPSAVNDGMRQVQADIREFYNDVQWVVYGDGDGAFTVSFASGTSFTIASANVTAQYHAGRRVRAGGTLTGTIYGTITSSSFSINTTVNVAWDSGTLQNEALTIAFGILSATNQSIPQQYNGGITGEIRMYGGSSAPTGWLLCDGAEVSRTTFVALFAIIGTTFGVGDGSTKFNLPDLRGRGAIGAGQGNGLTNRALGANVGAEAHALSTTELASHSHGPGTLGGSALSAGSHSHTMDVGSPDGTSIVAVAQAIEDEGVDISTNAAGAHTHTVDVNSGTTASAGSGTAHNNMQPSLAVNFIIKS